MTFRTFRTLVVVGGVAAIGAIGAVVVRRRSHPRPAAVATAPSPSRPSLPFAPPPATPPARPPGPTPPPPPLVRDPTLLRPLDVELLHRLREGITATKVKDALPGPARVELHRDPDKLRAKIDLDRDGRWDEKWDLRRRGDEEEVKRLGAPADDEQYTEEYHLVGGRWLRKP